MRMPTGRDLERLLTGSWEDFESWLRSAIGGPFSWKIRPRDTTVNRQVVLESVCAAIKRHDGCFPNNDAFLERADS